MSLKLILLLLQFTYSTTRSCSFLVVHLLASMFSTVFGLLHEGKAVSLLLVRTFNLAWS